MTLRVSTGTFLSLVGPNGGGKTSLLRSAAGYSRPVSGVVEVFGVPVAGSPPGVLARRVAYLPEVTMPVFPVTAWDVITTGRYARTEDGGRAAAKAAEALGVSGMTGRRFDTLSSGERQRVLVAAALAQEPELLLLDEASGHSDPATASFLHRLLRRLVDDEGLTVVSATHDVNAALVYSDEMAGIRGGALLFHASPEEVSSASLLGRLYGTGFATARHPARAVDVILP